ncbi:tRNA 2-thiouridine(34) synthase MnmA [Robiginitalea sp. SC105]|uniref:tRNA 2-thiouridine(34) synthase MnmA n=1 Tax=Robiginitalea sp. SC105 TaxID=2762332 RepID=UPI00163A5768|nr:tRNA 2-thiouridine(34) synthase MnmA [Robiginitalea sp. SC105]MBC2840168.1 tRNA 2-thiouridine(34) synthase MnmA [Robiginitalea sp. SC105]
MTTPKKVVIGLSGGVDSSVAALLLKQQGYEVIGLFMKNWHDDSVTISKECPWLDDSNDALIVAEKLGIPFQTIDLSVAYKERIVDYMFREYERGRTPNPDVLCNREIKFDLFLKMAVDLGADYVATGHYCRKESEVSRDGATLYRLLAGKDRNKDQSYFLCQLNQEQLSRALFPIGELEKSEVRQIAAQHNLITADKKDSQGLCFIGKVRLPEFLQQQLQPREGRIVEIPATAPFYHRPLPRFSNRREELAYYSEKPTYAPDEGRDVGRHQGAHYFTIGQRKGLDVGGTPEPLFVIQTDVRNNIIYTGQGKSHPGLYRRALFVADQELHWVRPDLALSPDESLEVRARIRYRQELQAATLYKIEGGLYVDFQQPQSAITEGQFVAWYLGEELIGSGVIA